LTLKTHQDPRTGRWFRKRGKEEYLQNGGGINIKGGGGLKKESISQEKRKTEIRKRHEINPEEKEITNPRGGG